MGSVHFIGIGGTGLSAIARVLLERGEHVSGSDRQLSLMAQAIQEAGARVMIGHRPENVNGARLVVRSSAIPDDNVEVQAALRLGLPVLKRSDYLKTLTDGYRTIAVAGTHGKTTTTGMLATVLSALGHDPSFIVGSEVPALGVNAHAGTGPDFIIEADEYDGMFLGLSPAVAVVTNIEHDHPDCYPTPESFYRAFQAFIERVVPGGVVVVCRDDPGASALAEWARTDGQEVFTYGLNKASQSEPKDYWGCELSTNPLGGYDFSICRGVERLASAVMALPGEHNVRNALAALAAIDRLGYSLPAAAKELIRFTGTGRRFDLRGEFNGAQVIDDYAHHPTEIRATLQAARQRYPHGRIFAVWQPHTYSRARLLKESFAASFDDADRVLVSEIYPAREAPPDDGFSGQDLVAAMRHPHARFVARLNDIAALLEDELQPGDVLLVLSAGDADRISARLVDAERSYTNG